MATIEARITRVEHDPTSGWYTIHLDNPDIAKVTTKLEQKAREAASLKQSGDVALIEYSHKTRPNPHGGVYNNYYYERAATHVPEAQDDGDLGIETIATPQSSTGRAPTPPEDAWRMAKSTGAKLAVHTLPLMPVDQRTFDVQKQIAIAWASWIDETPKPSSSTSSGNRGPGLGSDGYGEPPDFDRPPAHTDDDIPF